jgi:hypothetical protein
MIQRKILYGLAAILLLLLLGLGAVAAINSFDAPLSPQVAKILNKEVKLTPEQMKAWYFALGVHAGAKTDAAEKRGEDLWSHPVPLDMSHDGWQADVPPCDHICTAQTLIDHPDVGDALAKQKSVVQSYVQLMQYGHGGFPFKDEAVELQFPPPLDAHKLFLLQLGQWLLKGGDARVWDLLSLSNDYYADFFKFGGFADALLAGYFMKLNAELVVAELQRRPSLRLPRSLVESFIIPDANDVLFGAAEYELKEFRHHLPNVRPVKWFPTRFLLRRNETLNHYWEIQSQQLASDCPETQAIESCIPAALWFQEKGLWAHIENPGGRYAVRRAVLNWRRIRRKLQKTSQDLVQLKAKISEHTRGGKL